MRFAGTSAVNWVELTTVVFRRVVLRNTCAPGRKDAPLMVSLKAGPPAVTVVGEIVEMVGMGGAMVSGSGFDCVSPFATMICASPT